MKSIMQETKYSLKLSENATRQKYLSKVISHLNNESIDNGLTITEKAKLYSSIFQGCKVLNDVCRDSTLEQLETRIKALEMEKAKP